LEEWFDPTQQVRNADGTYFQWYTSNRNQQLAGRNPLLGINQQNNFGSSYRSIEIFKRNIKCIFTRIESGS
jgi:iron complex outermembrane receptor protein